MELVVGQVIKFTERVAFSKSAGGIKTFLKKNKEYLVTDIVEHSPSYGNYSHSGYIVYTLSPLDDSRQYNSKKKTFDVSLDTNWLSNSIDSTKFVKTCTMVKTFTHEKL